MNKHVLSHALSVHKDSVSVDVRFDPSQQLVSWLVCSLLTWIRSNGSGVMYALRFQVTLVCMYVLIVQHSLYVYTAVQGKLAVDESTQVDLLTADGEYLYTAAAAALTVCTALL